MARDTEKKGWFKSVLAPQAPSEKEPAETAPVPAPAESVMETSGPVNSAQSPADHQKSLLSKDNQDKIALDVIVSIENMLKERQLLSYKNNGLEDQLAAANETIQRLKQEHIKKDQLIQEKSKEIRELENTLTHKQMGYDQLLEDYKEFQLSSNLAYEKLSGQLETETAKYGKLYEESTNAQYQSMLKINELEDKIRELQIENQKYTEQYRKIADEKAELLQTIQDFTERMGFSFAPKTSTTQMPE